MKKQFKKTILIKKQIGFSLLQLIIVIVTFGALAVYFAPRFLNLQGESHASILETLQVSIQAEISVVHGKAIIKNVHNKANASIELDSGKMVDIVYGYPAATEAAFKAFLDTKFATEHTGDFNITSSPQAAKAIIYPNSYSAVDNCRIEYVEAKNNTKQNVITAPALNVFTSEC
jgi:MSHA pilin protein MshA